MAQNGKINYEDLVGLSFTMSEQVKSEIFEPRGRKMYEYRPEDLGLHIFLRPTKRKDRNFYLSMVHIITEEDLWENVENPHLAMRII